MNQETAVFTELILHGLSWIREDMKGRKEGMTDDIMYMLAQIKGHDNQTPL